MAYALVISLKQTLEPLLDSSRSRIQIPNSEIRLIYNDLCYLKSFFDKMKSLKDSNSVEDLEKEIKDVLQSTQDLIEYHLSDLVHSGSEILIPKFFEGLGKVKGRLGSLINLLKAKEDYLTGGQQSAVPSVAISSSFDFGKTRRIVGLEDEVMELLHRIFRGESGLLVLSITGIAGIGKTTLAEQVYHNQLIRESFTIRLFVTVHLEYELKELLLSLLSQLLGSDELNELGAHDVHDLGGQLYKCLIGRRYLVVLDDIRDTRAWSELRYWFPRSNNSAIILTTRTTDVARGACSKENILLKRFLTKTESLELLCEVLDIYTFHPVIEKIGKMIVENLQGIPLALVEIGLLLSSSLWTERNLTALARDVIEKILNRGYDELPHHLKACFLYLGVFPPNYHIPTSQLFKLWAAEGFINLVSDEIERLEEKAEEYLEDLVSRCIVEVHERSSRGRIKSCGVSLPLHHLCVSEARKEKMFHVVKVGNENAPQGIEEQRRLGVHNNVLLGFKQVRNLLSSVTDARSLLCVGSQHQRPLQVYLEFRRLRVLHALSIRFWEFPHAVDRLVRLRYLAMTCDGELPPSISRLWNLEILIIRRSQRIHSSVILPLEIWKLRKLRHLDCMGFDLPDPRVAAAEMGPDSLFLDKLLTLSGVSAGSCTVGILSRMPRLMKIGIWFEPTNHAVENLCVDDNAVFLHLHRLESFKCVVIDLGLRPEAASSLTAFPVSLRKLTLGGCGFSWDLMVGIASLPMLQVLKLRRFAFCGREWTLDGGFMHLKYLLLEDLDVVAMDVESSHFPVLEHLLIRRCYKLQEIPLDFGELVTLSVIEVFDCSPSVNESTRRILEEQREYGNDDFNVSISSSWDPLISNSYHISS